MVKYIPYSAISGIYLRLHKVFYTTALSSLRFHLVVLIHSRLAMTLILWPSALQTLSTIQLKSLSCIC